LVNAAYPNAGRETRSFTLNEKGDQARRFRAATRHSRRVRMLRWAIPIVAILTGAAIALVSWFNPLRMLANLPLSMGDLVVSGTKIKMENPKISGFTRDGRRYDLIAEAAAQDLTQPGMIELQDLTASVETADKGLMNLSAAEGLYDTKKDILTLKRNIVVTLSKGDEGYFDEAVVNTRTGDVVSEKPVKVKMLSGTVEGNRFEMFDSGSLIRFEKGVVVNMNLNSAPAPGSPSAGVR
jgi:lipopolysaccharide export system protein LptC